MNKSVDKKNVFYDSKKIKLEIFQLLIVLIMIGAALYVYPLLPERVPIHWNALGEPDNYGSRIFAVFLLPFIYIIFYIATIFLPMMDPYRDNILELYISYWGTRLVLGIFFLVIYISTLLKNFYDFDIVKVILVAMMLLFIVLGYFIRHTKRNFFLGIRTPWTLVDDEIWQKTHEKGGKWMMTLCIILIIMMIFINVTIMFFVIIIAIMLLMIGLIIYSYFLHRKKYKH